MGVGLTTLVAKSSSQPLLRRSWSSNGRVLQLTRFRGPYLLIPELPGRSQAARGEVGVPLIPSSQLFRREVAITATSVTCPLAPNRTIWQLQGLPHIHVLAFYLFLRGRLAVGVDLRLSGSRLSACGCKWLVGWLRVGGDGADPNICAWWLQR